MEQTLMQEERDRILFQVHNFFPPLSRPKKSACSRKNLLAAAEKQWYPIHGSGGSDPV